MDLGLTSEQQMLVDSVRAFVEAELKPYEDEVERTNNVRPELIHQIHAAAECGRLTGWQRPHQQHGDCRQTLPHRCILHR